MEGINEKIALVTDSTADLTEEVQKSMIFT